MTTSNNVENLTLKVSTVLSGGCALAALFGGYWVHSQDAKIDTISKEVKEVKAEQQRIKLDAVTTISQINTRQEVYSVQQITILETLERLEANLEKLSNGN